MEWMCPHGLHSHQTQPYRGIVQECGGIVIIIIVHLRMQPEGYGAAITFSLSSRPVSHLRLPGFLRCCEVLLFCRLVSVFIAPSGG